MLEALIFPNKEVKRWLQMQLATSGPWNVKESFKERVNCLLNLSLSGLGHDAIDVREYLCNHDTDEIWVDSMSTHVLPFIAKQEMGINYGTSRC